MVFVFVFSYLYIFVFVLAICICICIHLIAAQCNKSFAKVPIIFRPALQLHHRHIGEDNTSPSSSEIIILTNIFFIFKLFANGVERGSSEDGDQRPVEPEVCWQRILRPLRLHYHPGGKMSFSPKKHLRWMLWVDWGEPAGGAPALTCYFVWNERTSCWPLPPHRFIWRAQWCMRPTPTGTSFTTSARSTSTRWVSTNSLVNDNVPSEQHPAEQQLNRAGGPGEPCSISR